MMSSDKIQVYHMIYVPLGFVMWITLPSSLKMLTSSSPFISVIPIFLSTPPSFLSSEIATRHKYSAEEDRALSNDEKYEYRVAFGVSYCPYGMTESSTQANSPPKDLCAPFFFLLTVPSPPVLAPVMFPPNLLAIIAARATSSSVCILRIGPLIPNPSLFDNPTDLLLCHCCNKHQG